MTLDQLTTLYRSGGLSTWDFACQVLTYIDPTNVGDILGSMPAEVIEEVTEYARTYIPGQGISMSGAARPNSEQVVLVRKWLDGAHAR